jgi:hypothetical protein
VSVEAELLEQQAPKTCQTIWNHLPLEGEGVHAIYSGSEIAFFISKDIIIEPENCTSRTIPGDVAYYFQPPGASYGWDEGISELCWFYDRDSRPSMPEGPVQVNIFARIIGDTSAFYALCYRIRREGAKTFRVERVG